MTVAPIDLLSSAVHLAPGGTIHTGPRTGPHARPGPGRDDWVLRVFHARTGADVHADHWEVHPEAEEIVSCLIGKMRLYLRPERPGRPDEEIRLPAGTAAVVPRGRWHRIRLDTPGNILAVTVPDGTRLEKR